LSDYPKIAKETPLISKPKNVLIMSSFRTTCRTLSINPQNHLKPPTAEDI